MSVRSSRIVAGTLAGLALAAAPAPAQQPQQKPRCDTAAHRQFDFWIGAWEVTTAEGDKAGENTITLILEGCVVHESWDGGGLSGQSFNVYSRNDDRWFQTWVDDAGSLLRLSGGMKDGAMVLSGETKTRAGTTVLDEIAWTPLEDGRVKQRWQRSTDGGKQWQDAFVGFYTKKAGTADGAP
jgi:hypothetical protein